MVSVEEKSNSNYLITLSPNSSLTGIYRIIFLASISFICVGIATVFYTVIGQSINKSESSIDEDILNKLSGMIRSTLAKNIKIRRIPKINFRFDESIEYSENIEKLLRDLK